jgi:SsrA-binding protein
MSKQNDPSKTIALNKRARFDYEILETIEAGIMLMGSEVKSLRLGKVSINEAFVSEMLEEGRSDVGLYLINANISEYTQAMGLYLINANISEYTQANQFGHAPKRPRRLLVKKRQMNKFLGSIRKKGMTIVPICLYFNAKGLAKLEIGLAKGKKTHDKREAIKERDWGREKARVMKGEDR